MRKFWGFYDNGKYRVGCSGQSVYVYDQQDAELARFRDMDYTYRGAFVPGTNIFVAKSNYPKMAIYDLDRLELIKKFRSGRAAPQDHGFAFTPDGSKFYNIESHSLHSHIAVYDVPDFSLREVLFADREDLVLYDLEFDPSGNCYIMGYVREPKTNREFIGRLADGKITDQKWISWKYLFYLSRCKSWQNSGFSEKRFPYDNVKYEKDTPDIRPVSLKEEYERL